MPRSTAMLGLLFVAAPLIALGACSGDADGDPGKAGTGGAGGAGTGGAGGEGGSSGTAGGGGVAEPQTCDEAASARTHVGCDFWPTVTANPVWSAFDFAVGVVNAGGEAAQVTVTRGGQDVAAETIPPNTSRTLYLPWVPELKRDDFNSCTDVTGPTGSVRVQDGAYHLVSSRPVSVYQFNAIQPGPEAGPPGKDWSQCVPQEGIGCDDTPCFSYTNEASLLLPSTSLTGNYRVTGYPGWVPGSVPPYLSITATEADTLVSVRLASLGHISIGPGVTAAGPGGEVTYSLEAGEVLQLLGTSTSDFSGSLVKADKPVQLITGMPLVLIPEDQNSLDHIEEVVLPAETLGRRYVIPAPTGALGEVVGQAVRIYGNVDGTTLTYEGAAPAGAPTTINAGEVVDLGVVMGDFEVTGDHAIGVATFLLGRTAIGMDNLRGDPAQSAAIPVEQYRDRHRFFAPAGYESTFVDIVQPLDALLTLDGASVDELPTPISADFGVVRVPLGPGDEGAHLLEASAPVGLQVVGHAAHTSFQYPGGMGLDLIAPPPDDTN